MEIWAIIEHRISIDNYVQWNYLSATLIIEEKDIDINYILDMRKNNLNSFFRIIYYKNRKENKNGKKY